MDKTLKRELAEAIDERRRATRGPFRISQIVADVAQTRGPEFQKHFDQILREWLTPRVARFVWRTAIDPSSRQISFGFKEMPEVIRVGRKWVEFREASAEAYLKYADQEEAKLQAEIEHDKAPRNFAAAKRRVKRIRAYARIVASLSKDDRSMSIMRIEEIRAQRRLRQRRGAIAARWSAEKQK